MRTSRTKTTMAARVRAASLYAAATVAAVASLAAAAAMSGCAAKGPAAPAGISTAVARDGRIDREISISGVLAPNRTVNIYPKLSGQVKEVVVDVGDRVAEGQLIVRIDAKELEAQLKVAEASMSTVGDQGAQAKVGIETARLNLDMAQKNYDRSKALFDTKVATQSQIDDTLSKLELAKTAYDNAQRQFQTVGVSGLAQAQAQADLIRVQISNSLIASPISGTVTNRNVNPGELSSPAAPLMTIADTNRLKLQGDLSQDEVLAIKAGDKVLVSVDGMTGPGYEGRVIQVGPIAAATGQYFPVAIGVANDGRLLAGMTAKARLSISSEAGVVIPLSAVAQRGGDSTVFVIKDGVASSRTLRLGPRNAAEVLVLAGLASGERVATSGTGGLQDGDRIKQIEAKPEGEAAR
jgi:HlyD family secretion protein